MKRYVLIIVSGTSPAVLSETVWGLAHLKNPIIPDEIVVLTTRIGKRHLCDTLLRTGVWSRLRQTLCAEGVDLMDKLRFGEAFVRVIPNREGDEIDDLREYGDHLCAADFILQQIRQYTETPDTIVLASIAGGRKTMSSLLFSCMTLLGREDDRIYHVLLPPAFEAGVEPPFYFPEKGVVYHAKRDGKAYGAGDVHCELFEVPYVRIRGWYRDKFKKLPPDYHTLVEQVQSVAPAAVVYPELEVNVENGVLKIENEDAKLSAAEFAVLLLLAQKCSWRSILDRLIEAHHFSDRRLSKFDWLSTFQEHSRFKNKDDLEIAKGDLAKVLSSLRKKLQAKMGRQATDNLVPLRTREVTFPVERIKWTNKRELADVCGCLFPSAER